MKDNRCKQNIHDKEFTSLAIMASGRGSNAKNILEAIKNYPKIKVSVLITDQPKAPVIEIAKKYDLKTYIVPYKECPNVEDKMLNILKSYNVKWVLLAGYMRLLGVHFLKYFYDSRLKTYRVVNIHPSLLPKHKGLNAYEKVWHSKDTDSGVTLHFVNENMDSGPIIIQKKFNKKKCSSLEEFKRMGLSLEHEVYKAFLERLNLFLTTPSTSNIPSNQSKF